MQKTQVRSLGLEGLLEKELANHSSILAWKSNGWRSLAGYSQWGCKESDMAEHSTHKEASSDLKLSLAPCLNLDLFLYVL